MRNHMQSSKVVHVIDDDEGVREGLCALLGAKGYVAQPHASCEEFLNGFSADAALCIVADLRMPGMGGLDLQTHLLRNSVDLPFIVITGHGDVPSAVRALKSGAADFIEKPVDGKSFIAAVERAVVASRAVKTQSEATGLAQERVAGLTPRERDVLGHLVEGNPNKVIAHRLKISPRTVENHRARLMVKMQADSVAELVRMALAAGISAKVDGQTGGE
ncbi:MAG: response regulator, partial [Aestuariivirga sp.]